MDNIMKSGKRNGKIRRVSLFDGEKFFSFNVENKDFDLIIIDMIDKLLTMDFDKRGVKTYTLMDGTRIFNLPFNKERLLKLKENIIEERKKSNTFIEQKDYPEKHKEQKPELKIHNPIIEKKLKIVTDILYSKKPNSILKQVKSLTYDIDGEEFTIPTDKVKLDRVYVELLLKKYDVELGTLPSSMFEEYDDADELVERVKHIAYNYHNKLFKDKSKSVREVMDLCGSIGVGRINEKTA